MDKNKDQMNRRKHHIAVLILLGCFLFLLAVNYTPKEAEPLREFNTAQRIYPAEVEAVYNYTDRIVFTPSILDIINKTFYDAENETALILDYNILSDKIIVNKYIIPEIEYSDRGSVSFYQPSYMLVKMTMHNHEYTCIPSSADLSSPGNIMCIYCPDKETILIYIKETKETLYYKLR